MTAQAHHLVRYRRMKYDLIGVKGTGMIEGIRSTFSLDYFSDTDEGGF